MQAEKTIIPIKISSRFLYVPLAMWAFFAFAAFCTYYSYDGKEDYSSVFYGYLFHSAWVAAVLSGITYLSLKRVELTTSRIVFKNAFGKQTQEYFLNEISDFRWANQPVKSRRRYGNNNIAYVLVYIEVEFKNGSSLVIGEDEIANFAEIRSWLFDYCVKNKIISIRPLEERKRSRYRK